LWFVFPLAAVFVRETVAFYNKKPCSFCKELPSVISGAALLRHALEASVLPGNSQRDNHEKQLSQSQ
jgi:hypothetical protein